MALFPDYVTAAELKSALGITGTADDAEIAFAITAASRAADHFTNRQFGQVAAPEARLYPDEGQDASECDVLIDDLMTTTGLVVETNSTEGGAFTNTAVLDTDFYLTPLNAAERGMPWTALSRAAGATQPLPRRRRSIRVTASWGWSAVPAVVEQACLIQAGRFFKRKDAPFGVAGSPELGSEMRLLARLDPDVQMLLSAVKRYGGP